MWSRSTSARAGGVRHCREGLLHSAELLIANYPVASGDIRSFTLRPYEARVYRLKS